MKGTQLKLFKKNKITNNYRSSSLSKWNDLIKYYRCNVSNSRLPQLPVPFLSLACRVTNIHHQLLIAAYLHAKAAQHMHYQFILKNRILISAFSLNHAKESTKCSLLYCKRIAILGFLSRRGMDT